jgi:hypothetical protein
MRKKTSKAIAFVDGLHDFIVKNPQFRKNTLTKSEAQIQTELRPLIIRYLENHFRELGFKDPVGKANKSFYWEGQESRSGKARKATFGSRNYPDFVIKAPYVVAVEYKQSPSGSIVKHGIGQSMMHTLSGDCDFVYLLFQDQTKKKLIKKSQKLSTEAMIIKRMQDEFNVFIHFV